MNRGLLLIVIVSALDAAAQRPPVKCVENSPERRGEEGCTILAARPLAGSIANQVFWHIDNFDSLEGAKKAAGPDSVAAEAHGSVWLMTVEPRKDEHRGGRHVAFIGPLPLHAERRYSMRVQSSLLRPDGETPVHVHTGPEVFYLVAGEQCLERVDDAQRLVAGESYVLPAATIHRGRGIGSAMRRALALVLYDPERRSSYDLADPPPLMQCK